jgi:xylulokinase
MDMISHQPGWAEQNPEVWWQNAQTATASLKSQGFDLKLVQAIGISYQMHGLVVVDKNQQVLRPSIIWCDSRAVSIGDKAFQEIGEEKALAHFMNSPGNFTASKLKWVQEHEPELYSRIDKIMLPGDYLGMCLTGEICTTASGLSEGILWDYQSESPASLLLEHYGISPALLPMIAPTFGVQGKVTGAVADKLGLTAGTPVAYRAGDQPNNAFSLNVLEPGELAATAGTSGVVYGITDQKNYDIKSRVNTFLHVNHTATQPRYGTLLCVNGTGILNRWLKNMVMDEKANGSAYAQMNKLASQAPIGSQGLVTIPYGNGAERSLENKQLGSSVHGLDFNMHSKAHLLRSAQEGIVFALNLGVDIMRGLGVEPKTVRAGDANMFLSPLFSELYNTDGAQGAARGAGIGAGIYKNTSEAFQGLHTVRTIEPDQHTQAAYKEAYQHWLSYLKKEL